MTQYVDTTDNSPALNATPGQVSAAALQQYLRYAKASQLNWQGALLHAGLTEQQLSSGDNVPGQQLQLLLQFLVQHAGNPLFGLQSGAYVQPGSYALLGYLVMSCANLGQALAQISPFEKLVGDMGHTTISQLANHTEIRWQCSYTDAYIRPQMISNVLSSWLHFARWLADNAEAAPKQVLLEFSHTDLQPLAASGQLMGNNTDDIQQAYEQLFGCPVQFNAPYSGLLIDNGLLSLPLRQPDKLLQQTLSQQAQLLLEQQLLAHNSKSSQENNAIALTDRWVHHCQQALSALLQQGHCQQHQLASTLGMTTRTLQRRLKAAGVSYQHLLDQQRLELAQQLLRHSQLSIADIAQQLGYAEVRSFHRSFKQHTGVTPGQYRRQSVA